MKAVCYQGDFAKALTIVGAVASKKSTLPILENVLIWVTNNHIVLRATDLETTVTVRIKAEIEEPGTITIHPKLLTAVVKTLPKTSITLQTNDKKQALIVKSQKSTSTFMGISADDFPSIVSMKDAEYDTSPDSLTLLADAREFLTIVGGVTLSASTDLSRPTLNNIKFYVNHGELEMVATNGFRLTRDRIDVSCMKPKTTTFLGGAKPLKVIAKQAGSINPGSEIAVSKLGQRIFILAEGKENKSGSFSDIEVSFPANDSKYPEYSEILPKSYTGKFVADRIELLHAMRTSQRFAKASGSYTTLIADAEESVVSLSSKTIDDDTYSAKFEVVEITKSCEVSFNGQYLIDILNYMNSKLVQLNIQNPHKPFSVTDLREGRGHFLYLIMPMNTGR